MIELAITIINHRRPDMLQRCLASVSGCRPERRVAVYVLDNRSDDGSCEMVRRLFPGVTLIEGNEPRGFSANQNILFRHSAGNAPYTMLLNNDTELTPGAVDLLVQFMDEHPEAAAVSPKLVLPNGAPQPAFGAPMNVTAHILRLLNAKALLPGTALRRWIGEHCEAWLPEQFATYVALYREHDKPFEVPTVSGACMVVRREALEQVGLFDEQFFMYSEDSDWSRRASAAGWRLYVQPRAIVMHHVMQSFGSTSIRERERSALRYLRKYGAGELRLLPLRIAIVVGVMVRIVWQVARAFTSAKARGTAPAAIRAYLGVIKIALSE